MYISKYYTTEEIDQRLLQGYYDDFVKAGFVGSKDEFWKFVLSIADCVKKEHGKGLSTNDFTNELLDKLNSIEKGAKAVTKISQLENDLRYQTEDDVKQAIKDLIGGASDALDTLKELEEALGGDPNFANTITNKLTEVNNKLIDEISRAKQAENGLAASLESLKSKLESVNEGILKHVEDTKASLEGQIKEVSNKTSENKDAIKKVETSLANEVAKTREYSKNLADQEKERATAAEKLNADSIHALENTHITDKAALESKISLETSERKSAIKSLEDSLSAEKEARKEEDEALHSRINKEIEDRKEGDKELRESLKDNQTSVTDLEGKLNKETEDRKEADNNLHNDVSTEREERRSEDKFLENKITLLEKELGKEVSKRMNDIFDLNLKTDNIRDDLDKKKVDKVEGKGLSTNDFSDIYKKKLDEIEEGARKIERTSQLINDSDFQTSEQVKVLMDQVMKQIIAGAPDALDTLKELAEAIGDDKNFAGTITNKITKLAEQLNTEKERATAAENTLQEKINDEKERATTIENNLKASILEEANHRKEGEILIRQEIGKNKDEQGKVNKELKDSITNLGNSIKDGNKDLLGKLQTNTAAIQRNLQLIQGLEKGFSEAKEFFKGRLDAETQQRVDADEALKNEIIKAVDGYTKAIGDLKQTLEGALETEKSARIDADNTLQKNIDKVANDLTEEKSQRKTDYEVIQNNLNAEAKVREEGYNANKQAIEAEAAAREEADKALTKSIEDEVKAREAEDGALSVRINNEIVNRERAVTFLDAKIGNETAIRQAEDTKLTQAIKDETAAREAAIKKEAAAREEAKTILTQALDKAIKDEAAAREAADSILSNALQNEVDSRELADKAIGELKTNQASLEGKLNKETEDRTNADTDLSDRINDITSVPEEEIDKAYTELYK